MISEKLTFSPAIRATTATINRLCSRKLERRHLFLEGHVGGIKNLVYDKAIDMALLYQAICSGKGPDRLVALARLRDEAYNYQGLEMPYNARRVLIALMKETVKSAGNLRVQHRYIAAFRQALSGRAYVVRSMLDQLGLAEVPESEARAAGWDDHVYDNAGAGRKTPAQLVLDAYVKGISKLTIVYEDLLEREALEEAVEAGRIMGIEVALGIECLVEASRKRRFYHVLLLEGCGSAKALGELLEEPSVHALLKLVQGNYAEYDRLYAELIREFNKKSLPAINEGFEGTEGEMRKLSVEGLRAQAKGKYIFHAHLGQLLHQRLDKLRDARKALAPGREGAEDLKASELRRLYFDPLYKEILARGEFVAAERVYGAVAEIERALGSRRVRIAFVRPLDGDLRTCVAQLLANSGGIDAIEVWSNRARRQEGYDEDARALEELRRRLNRGDGASALAFLASRGLEGIEPSLAASAAAVYRERPLEARFGSHSDGYSFTAPGMGFAPRDELRNWRALLWTNKSSPLPVALPGRGLQPDRAVVPLGKDRDALRKAAALGRPLSLLERWGDLSSSLRDSGRMLIGALLALLVGRLVSLAAGLPPSFGLGTLAAFFVITYGRNLVVDEIAVHGLHPSRWKLGSFDAANAANSVFFSFLSIPILRLVEQLLDRYLLPALALPGAIPAGAEGFLPRVLRFVPLAIINGLYIYAHNSLRGFTPSVRRANFLRSAPAFLLATALSYIPALGALFSGVVINKIASDIIGGVTEASFKILRESRRARLIYAELLPLLAAHPGGEDERRAQRLAVLDVLYVWGNAPRGKETLRKAIEESGAAEQVWPRLAAVAHKYESFVRLITDKTAWRKKQRIKLEFLRLAAAFSYWLERNGPPDS